MPSSSLFLVIFYFGVSISFGIISLRNKHTPGGKSIFILALASLISSLSYLYLGNHPDNFRSIPSTAFLFGMTIAITAVFTYALEDTKRSYWLRLPTFLLLAILPLLTQIFYWIPEATGSLTLRQSLSSLEDRATFVERCNQLYWLFLFASSVWMLAPGKLKIYRLPTLQSWATLIGPLLGLATSAYALIDISAKFPTETLLLLAISTSMIGFSYSTFFIGGTQGYLPRREEIVERMQDGWIVVDHDNLIMDFNQATLELTGLAREKLHRQPISVIWNDFPGLLSEITDSQKIQLERTHKVNDQWRYLNIHLSKINCHTDTKNGYLITWSDISNQRQAEKARQKARDEMFVLLNAISSAASQTSNLSEFLSEVIYQIVYPFRSQVILIYILDERLNQENNYENIIGDGTSYFLGAHLGISVDQSKHLFKFPTSYPLFTWLSESKRPLLLKRLQDNRLPETMQLLPITSLLAISLVNQTVEDRKLIGAIILGRKEAPEYSQDEIERLSLLSEQIAILVDSDRRRKLAILLSERQRLMRDMHDSVSQKIYGLVTLTEAAQAAIEANSPFDYLKFITRINENARQAVKELRLFLFQMRPIDVEKEGLISVLHHRLAAVEGRADIKARFLADDVTLSKREEIALYFIAQEALNNVLRHAKAKSVTVTLRQDDDNIVLEISDDGCGFDPEHVAPGGMGLTNIEERVRQLNGNLNILSQQGTGTTIEVILEKHFLEDNP